MSLVIAEMTSPVEASVSKRLISWLSIDLKYAILIFAACLSPVYIQQATSACMQEIKLNPVKLWLLMPIIINNIINIIYIGSYIYLYIPVQEENSIAILRYTKSNEYCKIYVTPIVNMITQKEREGIKLNESISRRNLPKIIHFWKKVMFFVSTVLLSQIWKEEKGDGKRRRKICH